MGDNHYILPTFLFDAEYSNLTNDARVLYALLLDGQKMSIENNWRDEDGFLYLFFKRETMRNILSVSDKTVTRAINILKDYSLVKEVRQGWTQPNKIYLLPRDNLKTGNISDSRVGEFPIHDTEILRNKNRNISDSRDGEFTVHETKDLRINNETIFESRIVDSTIYDPEEVRIMNRNNSDLKDGESTIQDEVDAVRLRNKNKQHVRVRRSMILAARCDSLNWLTKSRPKTNHIKG